MDNSYGIENEKRVCKNCGANLPIQSNFCMHCGVNNDDVYGNLNATPLPPPNINMEAEEGICRNCGEPLPSTGFCMHCGYNNNETYGTRNADNSSAGEVEEENAKYKFIEHPGKLSYVLFGIILVDLIIMLGSLLFQNIGFSLDEVKRISSGDILSSIIKDTGTLGFLLIVSCIGCAIFIIYKNQQENFGKKLFKTTIVYVIGYVIAIIVTFIMEKGGFRINLLVTLVLSLLERSAEIITYAAFTVIILELIITFLKLINLRNIPTYLGSSIVAVLLLLNLFFCNSATFISTLFIIVVSWSFLCTDTKNIIIWEETNKVYAFLSVILFVIAAIGVFVISQVLNIEKSFLGILVAVVLCGVVTFLKEKFVFKDFATACVLAGICLFASVCVQKIINVIIMFINMPAEVVDETLFKLLLVNISVTLVIIILFTIVGAVLGIILLVLHKVLNVICRKIHMNGILFKVAIAMCLVSCIIVIPVKYYNLVVEKVTSIVVDLILIDKQ